MAKQKQPYRRLPDNSFTLDVEEYLKRWHEVIKRAESFFPGYKVTAFDPDIKLKLHRERCGCRHDFGPSRVMDTVCLSLRALRALEEGRDADRTKAV